MMSPALADLGEYVLALTGGELRVTEWFRAEWEGRKVEKMQRIARPEIRHCVVHAAA